MYLKRLELQGFKSFADKTVLDFGQGVTTVVGPNGSGKSNISDAIRWVMGEMSAKTLRGANMQDVIFAGTENRKQVNFAQVSLVLDNTDKLFPVEYDEVVVTRKVYRSGETGYQINHTDCRLRDIHELFMDTGLGRDGYSMIGQGNVSQILSTKAEDRRSFFEEAAGVSKYKHRKEEALRKLTSVTENLIRINDITVELESRLGPLENQSKKARKYMVLYEEYKGLDVSMCLINLEKNAELLNKCRELYKNISEEIDELKAQETEIEKQRDELYLKSSQKDEEQTAKNNELIENEAKSMACSNEISIAQNDIKNNHLMSERIAGELIEIENKIKAARDKISELQEKIKVGETEKSELMSSFEDIQKENSEMFDKLRLCKESIDGLKISETSKMNEISSLKAEINGMEKLRASIVERSSKLEAEISNHKSGIENVKKEITETEKNISEKSEKFLSMQERINNITQKRKELTSAVEENNKELSSLQVSLNSKVSKKKILESMENNYEGFSKSVKAVMTSPELKKSAIYGTVSGLIEVSAEYVTAIEIALGGAMQNIVVESEDDAKKAISFLKNQKAGRATFLPISSVNSRTLENENEVSKQKGYIGIASDLITYNKKYDAVMKSLLGRVVVADNMDNAVLIAKKYGYRFKIVTTEGELLNAGGSISGGSVNKTSGFLSRSTEIKGLGKEISELTVKIKAMQEQTASFKEDLEKYNSRLSTYEPLMREYENEALIAKNTLKHLKDTLENSGNSEKSLHEELAGIKEKLTKSAEDIAEGINKVRAAERELEETKAQISEKEKEYDKISSQKDLKAKELMDETLRLRNLEKDIELEKAAITEAQSSISENKEHRIKKLEEKQAVEKNNEVFEKLILQKNEEIESIKQVSEAIKEDIVKIEAEKQAVVAGLKNITNDNKDLTDRLMVLQQELSKAEAKEIKYENDSENILTRLWDEYELTKTTAAEVKTEIENPEEARQRVSELKTKIKALGSVNVDAIEEYVATKERFDFLSEQKSDLEKSQDNLNQVVASMQELMEEHFQKQFEEINKAFQRVFSELFGGGRGRLYLSNPEEVMESGIEIEVQLPGKGLQNINLYSGGEKSFIAIALLFAILEVKPTPFCFLDEIDAALDDVNVSRFATYLKNYLNATQFIVITHRRGTMEAANTMYGVTMQEKGVSKLLSLQMDEVDDELLK